eukprot:366568-Chlamydomonas_euryale.AAC.19
MAENVGRGWGAASGGWDRGEGWECGVWGAGRGGASSAPLSRHIGKPSGRLGNFGKAGFGQFSPFACWPRR